MMTITSISPLSAENVHPTYNRVDVLSFDWRASAMCMLPYSCRCNDENGSPILINDRLRTNPFIFQALSDAAPHLHHAHECCLLRSMTSPSLLYL